MIRPAATNSSMNRLGEPGLRLSGQATIIALASLALSVVIALLTGGWERFFRSYLMAFMFILSLSLGALFFTMLQHVTRSGWSVAIRRLAEGVMSNLMWIWILFVPVVIGMLTGQLYDWTDPAHHDEMLAHKAPYLNTTFWLIRSVAFFAIWFLLARFFWNNSIVQDSTGDVNFSRRLERFAPVSIILYALTQSFASMDWIMSLEAHWFSTMFPVYFFAASACGFFSLLILTMFWVQHNGRLREEITADHYHEAGKLLFFALVFWSYIAFSQYMLIWYANLPEETTWYMTRQMGGWLGISLVLLFGHFAIPFLFMMSRYQKRRPQVIAVAGGWMLLMHAVDMYWLVMPTVPAERLATAESYVELARSATNAELGYGWHVLDLTCLIGLIGLLVAGTARRLTTCSLIPAQDPRLPESLAFENL